MPEREELRSLYTAIIANLKEDLDALKAMPEADHGAVVDRLRLAARRLLAHADKLETRQHIPHSVTELEATVKRLELDLARLNMP